MSSTSDTDPTSQAVEVTDKAEHYTPAEKLEKATEGAEEAVSHFVLGTDKEESRTENVNGTLENQTNGEPKDESTDGAIGVPVEKTDSEPVTSAPTIDPKDDISPDVITPNEHTSTSIPSTELSKPDDASIIHHHEESGDKSEEESEAAKEEILIPSSDEAKTEERLGTDDTKESQAVEVESVQEPVKEEPEIPTHDDTKAHATSTPEEIPPTPKHETEGEAASTETPVELSPEHLEHSSPATNSENAQLGANGSAGEAAHTDQGTMPEMDYTASPGSVPVVASEAESETHAEDTKEESDSPHVGEEATIKLPAAEEEMSAEEMPLEAKKPEESEEVCVAVETTVDLGESEVIEASAVQAKDETESRAEEPAESAPIVDNNEAEDSTAVDSADAGIINDPDAQSHTISEEGSKEEASVEESELETESNLVWESKPEEGPKTEAAELTTEATLVSEEPQEEPLAEEDILEPLNEERTPQEIGNTPKAEASVEENSSEKAATEIPISAEVISEVKEDEAPTEPELTAGVIPEQKETEAVYEAPEATAPTETAKVGEGEAAVQKDEVSSESPMVEELKPEEEWVVSVVGQSEHVEELAVPAAIEEAELETETNGKDEAYSDEAKEEEPKSYTEVVQESAPEPKAEPEASAEETPALVETETEPELFVITGGDIEETLIISGTIDETPAPAATEKHMSHPEAGATEQIVLVEGSDPVPVVAGEHSELAPVDGEALKNGESSAAVESGEVEGEAPVVEEEPKAEGNTLEESKVEGDTVAGTAAEAEETDTKEPAGEATKQAPLDKPYAEIASEKSHVEATEVEEVPATEGSLGEGSTPVAEEPAPEVAQTSGPAVDEVLAEETLAVVEQAAEKVSTRPEQEAPHAQDAPLPMEDSVVEEKPSEEAGESTAEGVEATPEVLAVTETAAEKTPDTTTVEELAPEGSSATEETSTLEAPKPEQTTSGEVSALVDGKSAEQQAAAEELGLVAVEESETEAITPITEDIQTTPAEEAPAAEQEQVAAKAESAPEHVTVVDELVIGLECPAVGETHTPSIKEVSVEEALEEHTAVVEELVTEAPAPDTGEEQVAAPEIAEIPVELAAVEDPVAEAAAPAIQVEEGPVPQIGEAPAVEEVPAATAEDPTATEGLVDEAATPAVEEQVVSAPAIKEASVEEPPVEHPTIVEPVAGIATPAAEEVDVPTPEIELVAAADDSPAEEPINVEEPASEAVTHLVQEEEVRAPEIEETPVEQPPAEHAIVEEPVAETLTTSALEQEEVSTSEGVVGSVTEAPTAPTPEQVEISALAIEEDLMEELPVEHALIEEPVTEAQPTPAPEQQEASAPTMEEAPVEKPVAESPPTPAPDQEEISAPAIEEILVENPPVEHTLVEEPVTKAPTPAPEQEVSIPAIEEVSVENAPVEKALAEEPATETVAPAVQEEELISLSIEEVPVEHPSVEKDFISEPVTEAPVPVIEQEQVSAPAIEEEPVTTVVTPTLEEEQISAPDISEPLVQESMVEHVTPLEEQEAQQRSLEDGAAGGERETEATEPTVHTEAESAESDIIAPTAEVPEEEPMQNSEPGEEGLKAEAIDELQGSVSTEGVDGSMEASQEQSEAEPAVESHEAATVTPGDHSMHAKVAPIDMVEHVGGAVVEHVGDAVVEHVDGTVVEHVGGAVVEIEAVTLDLPVSVHHSKPEEDIPESEDQPAPVAGTENTAMEYISESTMDAYAPVEVPPTFPGDVPSINQEEETAAPVDPLLAQEAEIMDKWAVTVNAVVAKTPTEETLQEQHDFGTELAVAQSGDVSAEVTPEDSEEEQQPTEGLNETPAEMPKIPVFVVTKTEENQPSYGGDFGDDATTSQGDSHELPKVDVAPEASPVTTEGVEAIGENTGNSASEDEFEHISHADAVPDEQEFRHRECATAEETHVELPESIDTTAPTPIQVAAEVAAAVGDTAAELDPTNRSIVPTPISVAAETAAAVEDIAAILDVDETRSKAPTPVPQAAETAAAVQDTAATLDPIDLSAAPTPILVASETAAAVGDTAATLDVNESGFEVPPIPEADETVAAVENTAERSAVSTPIVEAEGAPTGAAIPAPSPMVETPVTPEIEAPDHTKTAKELDTTILASAIPREPTVGALDDVAAIAPVTGAPKDEIVEPTVEGASVPRLSVGEGSKSGDGLSGNLFLAGIGLAGAALIGGGTYTATRDDKTEGVPMTRTITNESSRSVHDKPLSFNGDHILPHMKEVGPQVAETEVHRAEIVRPTANMLSKSVDSPAHDSGLLGHEPRKDVDLALKDQLTDNQSLIQPQEPESIPEPEPAHSSKGKEPDTRTPGSFPESVEEDELVELLESSGHLQAPHMQRDPSGSSEFAESLISVDAISEALRYMRENNSEAAFRPPDIVVSEETTNGEHRTRNIVEVITPDTELITEPEPRRRDPGTKREQSRPSTRGSDMVSATRHKNLMENFWKLVFVGWLGGMGKFFVGLFGRKNGEQLGSVYANYAASMRESQLMSQQNLNFEQHMGGNAKGKGKEKVRGGPREEEIKPKNGVNGNGVSVSNGASGAKAKESRRGGIKKKWNAYRKKGD